MQSDWVSDFSPMREGGGGWWRRVEEGVLVFALGIYLLGSPYLCVLHPLISLWVSLLIVLIYFISQSPFQREQKERRREKLSACREKQREREREREENGRGKKEKGFIFLLLTPPALSLLSLASLISMSLI